MPDAASSAGALTASGSSALCTYVPADWTTRCAGGLRDARLCARLARARGDVDRERVALALSAAASAQLGPMHFTHGARIVWSVDEVLRLAQGASDITVALAVRDANRAFDSCIDHDVLAAWVTTPVCGRPASESVEGPITSRCVALDADCRRGRYDAVNGCCDETDLYAGMVCGEDDAGFDGSYRDGDDRHGDRSRDDAHEHARDADDHAWPAGVRRTRSLGRTWQRGRSVRLAAGTLAAAGPAG